MSNQQCQICTLSQPYAHCLHLCMSVVKLLFYWVQYYFLQAAMTVTTATTVAAPSVIWELNKGFSVWGLSGTQPTSSALFMSLEKSSTCHLNEPSYEVFCHSCNVMCLSCRTCSWSTGTIHRVCWEETSKTTLSSRTCHLLCLFFCTFVSFISLMAPFSPVLQSAVAVRPTDCEIGRVFVQQV